MIFWAFPETTTNGSMRMADETHRVNQDRWFSLWQ
jgi:hypothetical protein